MDWSAGLPADAGGASGRCFPGAGAKRSTGPSCHDAGQNNALHRKHGRPVYGAGISFPECAAWGQMLPRACRGNGYSSAGSRAASRVSTRCPQASLQRGGPGRFFRHGLASPSPPTQTSEQTGSCLKHPSGVSGGVVFFVAQENGFCSDIPVSGLQGGHFRHRNYTRGF